jgi:hypothetical protein
MCVFSWAVTHLALRTGSGVQLLERLQLRLLDGAQALLHAQRVSGRHRRTVRVERAADGHVQWARVGLGELRALSATPSATPSARASNLWVTDGAASERARARREALRTDDFIIRSPGSKSFHPAAGISFLPSCSLIIASAQRQALPARQVAAQSCGRAPNESILAGTQPQRKSTCASATAHDELLCPLSGDSLPHTSETTAMIM